MASRSSRSSSRKPLTLKGPAFPPHAVSTKYSSITMDVDRDNPRSATVLLDGAPSSFIDLDNPTHVVFEYMEIFLAVLAQVDAGPLNVVHLGSAGSTMARAIEHQRPNSRQIGIDIDSELLDFSREWFDLPRAPRLRLRAGDARAMLEHIPDGSQDVIIRDVFADRVTPPHLTSTEFVGLVLKKLKPGGIYLANCADKPPLKIARRELATVHHAIATNQPADVELAAHSFMIAEPAILKGRRFGNLVIGLTKWAPQHQLVDVESAALTRALRTLAVPASLLTHSEVEQFAGTAAVIHDEQEAVHVTGA